METPLVRIFKRSRFIYYFRSTFISLLVNAHNNQKILTKVFKSTQNRVFLCLFFLLENQNSPSRHLSKKRITTLGNILSLAQFGYNSSQNMFEQYNLKKESLVGVRGVYTLIRRSLGLRLLSRQLAQFFFTQTQLLKLMPPNSASNMYASRSQQKIRFWNVHYPICVFHVLNRSGSLGRIRTNNIIVNSHTLYH